MGDHDRRGLRLFEVIILVNVVGALLGLMIVGLTNSRGTSRRLQCSSNLRSIGLGLNGVINSKNQYPNAGTFRETAGETDVSRSVINHVFEVGKPGGDFAKSQPLRSWVVDILPDLGDQNSWNYNGLYDDGSTNSRLASRNIGVFKCPESEQGPEDLGGLSYVVNGGFTRWHAVPYTWEQAPDGGVNGTPLNWIGPPLPSGTPQWDVTKMTGVMFLGTHTGKYPWDARTTPIDLVDGSSHTVLATENLHAGASKGSKYADGFTTNWACPHPNFMMFVGSDRIARPGRPYDCADGTLALQSDGVTDGPGWAEANRPGTFGGINHAATAGEVGSSLGPSSGHRGGVNVLFCDGSARFVKETIDGTVWSKLLTPAGGSLPAFARQGALDVSEFE